MAWRCSMRWWASQASTRRSSGRSKESKKLLAMLTWFLMRRWMAQRSASSRSTWSSDWSTSLDHIRRAKSAVKVSTSRLWRWIKALCEGEASSWEEARQVRSSHLTSTTNARVLSHARLTTPSYAVWWGQEGTDFPQEVQEVQNRSKPEVDELAPAMVSLT